MSEEHAIVSAQEKHLQKKELDIVRRGLEAARSLEASRRIRILIVDDIAETRANLRDRLSGAPDLEVVGEAGDGVEAIEQYEALLPDVMTTCISMPKMDGITATEAICERHPDAQIIIVTVHNELDYMMRAMMAGARDVIQKPPDADELKTTIRYLAGRTRTGQTREPRSNPTQDRRAPRRDPRGDYQLDEVPPRDILDDYEIDAEPQQDARSDKETDDESSWPWGEWRDWGYQSEEEFWDSLPD